MSDEPVKYTTSNKPFDMAGYANTVLAGHQQPATDPLRVEIDRLNEAIKYQDGKNRILSEIVEGLKADNATLLAEINRLITLRRWHM